ncbi:hypothetical protein GCM10023238_33960 [Streptomyces heliomycini]
MFRVLIRIDSVTKRYPDGTVAVDRLSLEIPDRSITVLVGPSGCGKTTTLRMINRMVEPTEERSCSTARTAGGSAVTTLRRSMGYVIQNAGLFQHRTIVDNIATVPRLLAGAAAGPGAGGGADGAGGPGPLAGQAGTRTSSPADSSSASAWRGRSPRTRRCC